MTLTDQSARVAARGTKASRTLPRPPAAAERTTQENRSPVAVIIAV